MAIVNLPSQSATAIIRAEQGTASSSSKVITPVLTGTGPSPNVSSSSDQSPQLQDIVAKVDGERSEKVPGPDDDNRTQALLGLAVLPKTAATALAHLPSNAPPGILPPLPQSPTDPIDPLTLPEPGPENDPEDEEDTPENGNGPRPLPLPIPIPLPEPRPAPPPDPDQVPAPIPEPVPEPVPEPRPIPKPHPNGDYFVQILATPIEASICAIWDALKAELPELFEYAERSITRIETDDNQVLFRLRVGAFLARSEATQFCQLLKDEGHSCFVTTRNSAN